MDFGLRMGQQLKNLVNRQVFKNEDEGGNGWDLDEVEDINEEQANMKGNVDLKILASLQQVFDMRQLLELERNDMIREIQVMKQSAQEQIEEQKSILHEKQLKLEQDQNEAKQMMEQANKILRLTDVLQDSQSQEQVIEKIVQENIRMNDEISELCEMQQQQNIEYEDKIDILQKELRMINELCLNQRQSYLNYQDTLKIQLRHILKVSKSTMPTIHILKQDIATIKHQFHTQIKQYQQHCQEMINELQQEIDSQHQKISKQYIQINELKKENEEFKSDCDYTTKVLKQVRQSEDSLIEENNRLEMKIVKLYQQLDDHQLNVQILEQRLYDSENQYQKCEELEGLEEQIERIREEKIELKLDLQARDQIIEELKAQLNLPKQDPWNQEEDPWNINDSSLSKVDELEFQLSQQKLNYEKHINELKSVLKDYETQLKYKIHKEETQEEQLHQLQLCLVDTEFTGNYQNQLLQEKIEQLEDELSVGKDQQELDEEEKVSAQQFNIQNQENAVERLRQIEYEELEELREDGAWQLDMSLDDDNNSETNNQQIQQPENQQNIEQEQVPQIEQVFEQQNNQQPIDLLHEPLLDSYSEEDDMYCNDQETFNQNNQVQQSENREIPLEQIDEKQQTEINQNIEPKNALQQLPAIHQKDFRFQNPDFQSDISDKGSNSIQSEDIGQILSEQIKEMSDEITENNQIPHQSNNYQLEQLNEESEEEVENQQIKLDQQHQYENIDEISQESNHNDEFHENMGNQDTKMCIQDFQQFNSGEQHQIQEYQSEFFSDHHNNDALQQQDSNTYEKSQQVLESEYQEVQSNLASLQYQSIEQQRQLQADTEQLGSQTVWYSEYENYQSCVDNQTNINQLQIEQQSQLAQEQDHQQELQSEFIQDQLDQFQSVYNYPQNEEQVQEQKKEEEQNQDKNQLIVNEEDNQDKEQISQMQQKEQEQEQQQEQQQEYQQEQEQEYQQQQKLVKDQEQEGNEETQELQKQQEQVCIAKQLEEHIQQDYEHEHENQHEINEDLQQDEEHQQEQISQKNDQSKNLQKSNTSDDFIEIEELDSKTENQNQQIEINNEQIDNSNEDKAQEINSELNQEQDNIQSQFEIDTVLGKVDSQSEIQNLEEIIFDNENQLVPEQELILQEQAETQDILKENSQMDVDEEILDDIDSWGKGSQLGDDNENLNEEDNNLANKIEPQESEQIQEQEIQSNDGWDLDEQLDEEQLNNIV